MESPPGVSTVLTSCFHNRCGRATADKSQDCCLKGQKRGFCPKRAHKTERLMWAEEQTEPLTTGMEGASRGSSLLFTDAARPPAQGWACRRCSTSVCQGSGRIPAQTLLTEESGGTSSQQRKDRLFNKLCVNDQLTSTQ